MTRVLPPALLAAGLLMLAFQLDLWVARRVALTDDTAIRAIFAAITELGRSHWYLVPSGLAALAAWWLLKTGKLADHHARLRLLLRHATLLFAAVALSGIAVNILKPIFGRARPRMLFEEQAVYGFDWFTLGSDFAAFPSGHTATAISVAVIAASVWPRHRYSILAVFSVIAVSRVAVNAHYLADVVAGTILAYAISAALLRHHRGPAGFADP